MPIQSSYAIPSDKPGASQSMLNERGIRTTELHKSKG